MPLQCRTCGSVIYNINAKNLFEPESEHLLEQIHLLTGIQLQNTRDLPDCICACCLLDLSQAIIFRERCISTQDRLQNVLSRVELSQALELPESFAVENIIDIENINFPDKANAESYISDDCEDDMDEVTELFGLSDNEKEISTVDSESNVDGEDCDFLISNLKKELCSSYDDDIEATEKCEDISDKSNSPSILSSPNISNSVENLPTVSRTTTLYAKSRKGTVSNLGKTLSCKPKSYQESGRVGPNGKKKYISWKNMTEEEIIERKRASRRRDCVCDQCGRHFNDVSNFKLHMLRHTGNKEYACNKCDMQFYTEHLLSLHSRTRHQGERPYKCQYCQKTFSSSTTRSIHERSVHTKARPYRCSFCEKKFSSASGVKRHELIHTGVRNYQCTICDQKFQRNTHLRAHLRSKQHKIREQCGDYDIIAEFE